jgi:bifunctional non-homologous end joining protein LigD
VIGGYTEPAGSRSHFGALLLGLSTEKGLVYAGKVGTGFTEQSLRDLARRMKPLGRAECPFVKKPPGSTSGKVHWLEPKLVAEVRFAERTRGGLVRQASFQGLRQDKPAEEVHDEVRVSPARARGAKTPEPNIEGVSLTHPDRVLFPQEGLTKLDLATHYAAVADWMLPHVSGRPLMVLRCPDGVNGECFYQKHPSRGLPNAVMAIRIEEKKGPKEHLTIDSLAGLLGLVQIGGLEIHTWGSRNESLDCPDRLTFDLDPAEDLPWERVVEAALRVKEELARLGLQAFVKTTGGKGLHVVTPIEPTVPWDKAKAFSKRVVEQIAKAEPGRYLTTMRKDKRRGRVFLDYLRNGKGATSVCAYSTRAKPGALVATPLTWQELSAGARPEQFDVAAMIGRMKRLRRDPWFELDAHAVRLTDKLLRQVAG